MWDISHSIYVIIVSKQALNEHHRRVLEICIWSLPKCDRTGVYSQNKTLPGMDTNAGELYGVNTPHTIF